jgi:hypothetical protein
MFDVSDWNLNPNQKWFVRLSDAGAAILVELFNSLADLDVSASRVAYASVTFGADVKVLLIEDSTAPLFGPMSKFNSQLDYHLKVNGQDGDQTKRFAIGPFVDLPPVEDPLMLSEEIIQARATLEINRGTHSILTTSVSLAEHYPDLDCGDIVEISSTRRALVAVKNRVNAITITARIDGREVRFNDQVEAVRFVDFIRQS